MTRLMDLDVPFYRNLIHSLPMNMAVLDEQGNIVDTNRNWDEFGIENDLEEDYCLNYVDYLNIRDKSGESYAKRAIEGIQDVIEGRMSQFRMEYPSNANNQKRWFIMQVYPFYDSYSNYFIVTHLDVTDRRISEKKNQRLSSIVHNIPVCIMTLNHVNLSEDSEDVESEFVITNFNSYAEEVTGLQHQDILGKRYEDVFEGVFEENMKKKFQHVIRTNEIYEKDEIKSVDLNFEGRVWNFKIFNVTKDYLAVVFEDVTEEVKNRELLEYLAAYDGLTGIPNRNYFLDQLQVELDRANRYDRNFSLILMDLDHFKSINDRYGHVSGDEVLEKIGSVLEEHLRSSDVCGRYGGEEFGILLPETDEHGALQFAERLRQEIDELTFESDEGDPFKVTASFGVAQNREHDQKRKNLLRRTDWALYQAKENGRNRVTGWNGLQKAAM